MRARLTAFLGATAIAGALSLPAHAAFDPLALYGERIVFDVYRGGDRIGSHTVSFSQAEDGVKVDVDFKVAVKMLGLTVYRFEYGSSALWRDDRLAMLDAAVNDDGTRHRVTAQVENGQTRLQGPKGPESADGAVFPSNHWHPAVVGETRVINTLTGSFADVAIRRAGTEPVATNAGEVQAARYTYSGDLRDVDVWYDDRGRWVRMTFVDKSGETIEYRCASCVAAEGVQQ
ncbi:DUF6134 family protein [Minwuia sp.]|uniref:DUF6134 family protein n=1 Tax=Minwuia sp. TaxID=2493630 RepID=UPI003A91DB98